LVVDAKARRFSNYGSNLRKNVRFEPNPIVKVRIRVSRVKMNAKNGALDTRILTAGDPCAVFPKNGAKTVLTKPTLSYMGYYRAARRGLFSLREFGWPDSCPLTLRIDGKMA
jgi:hypothetical protein